MTKKYLSVAGLLLLAACDDSSLPLEVKCSSSNVREARGRFECANKPGCAINVHQYAWAKRIEAMHPECFR